MTFPEWVGQQFAQGRVFASLVAAQIVFAASGLCQHPETVFGECVNCGHKLVVEGTFKVNPDKTRYLTANPQVRSVLHDPEEGE